MTHTPARTVGFYDSIAADYDAMMEDASSHDWVRAAFHDYVARIVPPPARMLDFGAGTGTDAVWYAEHGWTVCAFDSSPGMIAQLRKKVGGGPRAASVSVHTGDFDGAIDAIRRRGPYDAVVANFAVLNLIADLDGLFADFASLVRPGGHAIVSVLNPVFWKDLKERWLWSSLLRSLGKPAIHIDGDHTDLYRHWTGAIVRAARPHFRLTSRAGVGALVRRVSGSHDWADPRGIGERVERLAWRTMPMTRLGQYFFLSFERLD